MTGEAWALGRWRAFRQPPFGQALRESGRDGGRALVLAPAGFGKRAFLHKMAERLRRQGWPIRWVRFDEAEPPQPAGERLACFIEEATRAQLETIPEHWAAADRQGRWVFISSGFYPADLARFAAWHVADAHGLALSARDVGATLAPWLAEPMAQRLVHYTAGWPAAIETFLQHWRGRVDAVDAFDEALAALSCRLSDAVEHVLCGCSARSRQFVADIALFQPLGIEAAGAICGIPDFSAVWRELRALAPLIEIDARTRIVLCPLLRDHANRFGARSAARSQELLDRAAEFITLDLQETVRDLSARGDFRLATRLIEKAGGLLLLVDHGLGSFGHLLGTVAPAFCPLQPPWLDGARRGFDVLRTNSLGDAGDADIAKDPAQCALLRALLLVNRAEQEIQFDALRETAAIESSPCEPERDPRRSAYWLAIRIFFAQRHGPLRLAEQLVEQIDALYRRHGFAGSAGWLTVYAARNAFAAGDLHAAERLAAGLLESPARNSDPPLESFACHLRAACAYERAEFDRIPPEPDDAAQLGGSAAIFEGDVARWVLPQLARAWNGEALHAVDRLGRTAERALRLRRRLLWAVATAAKLEVLAVHAPCHVDLRARLYRELDAVWQACTSDSTVPWLVVESVARARFLEECAATAGGPAGAATAARLFELASAAGYPLAIAAARVMLARAMLQARRHPAAKAMLQQALEIALPRAALRLLLPLGREHLGMLQRAGNGKDARIGGWHKRLAAIWERAHAVKPRLTPRELAILREVMEHKSSKLIARALGIAPETVKSHLKAMFAKCGATSRAELRSKFSALATEDLPSALLAQGRSAGSRTLVGSVAI